MFQKAQAIVLKSIKYSESAVIITTYSRQYGLLSFMVHGVRKQKSKFSPSFFQSLQLLELEFQYREKQNLQTLRDLSPLVVLHPLYASVVKSSVAVFMAEILLKVIQEEEANGVFFDFLLEEIVRLSGLNEKEVANFHLIFLMQLSRYLGFYPDNNWNQEHPFFDMLNGAFTEIPKHSYTLDKELSKQWHFLLSQEGQSPINHIERRALLRSILQYFRLHLPEMGDLKSLEVLEMVFGE
jgi:DNA repair protein RecO (recombination protein O)